MGALLLAPIQPPAEAALKATSNNKVLSVAIGTVRVFASDTITATSTNAPLNISLVNGRARTFWINNVGNLSVTRFTLTLSLPNGTNIASLRRCGVNLSFTGTGICESGGYTSMTVPPSTATVVILTIPANSFYSLQIVQNKNTTMTVNTSVNTAYISTGISNS